MSDAGRAAPRTGARLLLYDGYCGFCRFSAGVLLAWDRRRRLVPVAIQSPAGERALGALDPEARLASWHLAEAGGRVLSAGAAMPELLRLLPGGSPIAALAEVSPAATERLYQAVARRRAAFGRLVPASARRWADGRIQERTG